MNNFRLINTTRTDLWKGIITSLILTLLLLPFLFFLFNKIGFFILINVNIVLSFSIILFTLFFIRINKFHSIIEFKDESFLFQHNTTNFQIKFEDIISVYFNQKDIWGSKLFYFEYQEEKDKLNFLNNSKAKKNTKRQQIIVSNCNLKRFIEICEIKNVKIEEIYSWKDLPVIKV